MAANAAERVRLQALVTRLTESELSQPLSGGWTPAVALAHLAFWDRRATFELDRWARGLALPVDEPDWFDDMLNETLFDEWAALAPASAATLALEAAEAVDASIATLDPSIVRSIVADGDDWLVRRFRHRREHLDQIEHAFGAGQR